MTEDRHDAIVGMEVVARAEPVFPGPIALSPSRSQAAQLFPADQLNRRN